jgi:putative flippase GtrA
VKAFFEKYREIILYLIFGVLTTAVSFITYFLLFHVGVALIGQAYEWYVRAAAQILQWVAGVLFAFFTNKKYVFGDTNTQTRHMWRKLAEFSASRVLTLVLDTVLTFGIVALLGALSYEAILLPLVKIPLSADPIAKCVAAVFVIVGNYVLSKLFVFRKAKTRE